MLLLVSMVAQPLNRAVATMAAMAAVVLMLWYSMMVYLLFVHHEVIVSRGFRFAALFVP
jgi:ABC-type multidrug transport system permease subunit